MRGKHLTRLIIGVFSLAFLLFVVLYQRYALSQIRQNITEHVAVVAPAVWNYEENYAAYLTLAAQTNTYAEVAIIDRLGHTSFSVAGPSPTWSERWLMQARLMPLYRFQEELQYSGQPLGTLTVIWRCTTIYTYGYVAFCLALAATGTWLFFRLMGTNTQLRQAQSHLEQRVRERTAELAAANEALRASEQQFRDIAKNIPGMVYQLRVRPDGSTYFSYASPRGDELFGLPKDLSNQDWELGSRSHPDDRERFLTSIRESITASTDWDYEGRILLPDRQIKWFKGIASPTRHGEELVFNGILLDITERKHAENALQQSEEKFKFLIENANVGIYIIQDGLLAYVNPNLANMFGYTPAEIMGKLRPHDLIHPDDFPEMNRRLRARVSGHVAISGFIYKGVKKDGSLIMIDAYGMPITYQGRPATMGTLIDITERKRAEDALKKSEAQLRTLMKTIPDLVWLKDPEGVYLQCNQRIEQLFGAKESDIIGKTDDDFFDPILADSFRQHDLAAIAADQPTMNEERVTYADDGHAEDLETIKTPIYDNDGQLIGVLGIGRDITARKRAEEQLRHNEALLTTQFENSPDLIMVLDREYRYVSLNKVLFGPYTTEELIGQNAIEPLPPHVRELTRNTIDHCFATGMIQEFDHDVGEGGWLHARVVPLSSAGVINQVMIISTDITERKRAEEAYRVLVETSLQALVIVQAGRIVFVNPAAEVMAGYAAQELLALENPIQTLIHPEDLPGIMARASGRAAGEAVPPLSVYRIVQKSGQARWVESYTQQIEFRGKPADHTVYLDITDRKHAEEELQRYREHLEELVNERTAELEQARKAALNLMQDADEQRQKAEAAQQAAESSNQAKSVFLANMSHELRTPLNAVLGFSQLMQRDVALTETQRDHLDTIMRSGEHLLRLINDVLDMSRIEAGQVRLNLTTVDLWQVLQNIEEMLRMRAENNGLRFTVVRAPDVPRYIHTDESKLRQILVNLLGNAIKFTEKGTVTFTIDTCQSRIEDNAELSEHDSIVNLRFSIQDTGMGIAPDDVENIFTPFGRAQRSEHVVEGSGLGLAISRKFVQLLGGELRVESEVGNGSLFTFEIRVDLVVPPESRSEQPVRRVIGLARDGASADAQYRMLIVEDHPENRRVLSQLLHWLGSSTGPSASSGYHSGQAFEVQEAANGQEALELFERWQPHLIWMDIRMPVMDGYEATKRIRSVEVEQSKLIHHQEAEHAQGGGSEKSQIKNQKSKIPIIALTASAFEEDRARILAAGCDDVVRKPFKEQEILDILARHLGVRYLYEKENPIPDSLYEVAGRHSKPETLLTPEALAALPAEHLADLEDAILQGDVEWIEKILTEMKGSHAEIARELNALAQRFQYDKILAHLQRTHEGRNRHAESA